MDYNVFISYSSINEEQVKSLCEYLEDKGLKCFVSYRDIRAGESYPGAITRALRNSEMLLLILSKDSNESTQVDRELTLANDEKKKMSCFRLEDIPYSDDKAYLMSGVNWMDAFPKPEEHYFELLQDLCRQLGREVPQKEETEEEKRERHINHLGEMLYNASRGDTDAQHNLAWAFNDGKFGLQENNEEAFKWYMRAAKKGHIEAMNCVGVYYARGIFVKENQSEALRWYRLAALSGNEIAQSNLAYRYYAGKDGVERDYQQAVKWWKLSADQGFHVAQFRLGRCYSKGHGVEQNDEEAAKWYMKAAELDNDDAQIELARCYREGKGVKKDIAKCFSLLETAVGNNSIRAMLELAKMYDYGISVEPNTENAFKYAKMAADRDDDIALYILSHYYRDGIGCEKNSSKWFEYLTKAAEEGHRKAQCELGWVYSRGNEDLDIKVDTQKLKYWYQKAIDQDYTRAMVELALCYSLGGPLPLDDELAANLFRQAADLGDKVGQFYLSDEYKQGDGVEQNEAEAFKWCMKSAEQGYPPAMGRIGEYYFYGFGSEQDFGKAVEWLEKAAKKNVDDAQFHLGLCFEKGYGTNVSFEDAIHWYYYSSNQDNKKASEALEILIDEIKPKADAGDAESSYLMGCYYYLINEKGNENFVSYMKKAAEQEYKKAYNKLAWSLHMIGNFDEALPWAEKAVAAFQEDTNNIDTLACVYEDLGRNQEALEQFELCLRLLKEQKGPEKRIKETEEKIKALKGLLKSN